MISKNLAVLVLAFTALDALPAIGQPEKRQLLGLIPAATSQAAPGRATRLSENVFQMTPVDARSPYSSILMIFQMKQQTPGDAILDEAKRYASIIQQQQQRGMANAGQLGTQPTQSQQQQQQQQQPVVLPGIAPQAGMINQGASNSNTAAQPSPPTNAAVSGQTVAVVGQTGSVSASNPNALPGAPAALPTGSVVPPTNETVVSKREASIDQMYEDFKLSKRSEERQDTATGTSVIEEQHAESARGPKQGQQHREKVTIRAIPNEGAKSAGSARIDIALRNAAIKDSMEGLTSQ